VNGDEAEIGLATLSIGNAVVDCCCIDCCAFELLAKGFVDWRVGGKEETELPVGMMDWRKGFDDVC
jgi:hypothetical protein